MSTFYKLLILLVFPACSLLSAQVHISGKVTDIKGTKLSYVNVYIQNTFNGTMSDEEGMYSFLTEPSDTITIIATSIGYRKYTYTIDIQEKDSININIHLVPEAVKLNETVVSASSYGSEKEKGLIVSRIDIYTTPGGAADLFQSLKTLPGISQVSESAELYVRGGDPSETLTIVDQAGFYHPYTYESSYGGLFSNINTAMIKSMFFSSGGFSAKYGNSLSGILELVTIDKPAASGYSIGISMAALSAAGRIDLIDNKLGLNIFLNKSYTEPIMWLNGEMDQFTSFPTSQDISTSLIYSYSNTGQLKLLALLANDKTGVKVDRPELEGRFDGSTDNTLINFQHKDILNKDILIKSSISYSKHDNDWELGLLDINMIDETINFRSDLETIIASYYKVSGGIQAGVRVEKFEGKMPENAFDYRPNGEYRYLDDNTKQIRYGGYLEVESHDIFEITNLSLIFGLRSDYFPKVGVLWLDPRLAFVYKLNNTSMLQLSTGLFHQLPDSRLFKNAVGNPNLSAMNASHYILSYNYTINDKNNFRIELYHKKYQDLPLEDKSTNYSNKGYGFANGLDIIMKGELPFNISGWLSYGYLNTKRLWMDYKSITNSDFDISHQLTLIAKYNISSMWQIGINFKVASGRPYTPVKGSILNTGYNLYEPIYAQKNSDRHPTYKRLDLRITHFNQLFGRYNTILYLEGLNIINIKNIFGYTYNEDYSKRSAIKSYFGRRTIVIGASISF